MKYNTQRPQIHVREYGRNIQLFVDELRNMEDANERFVASTKTVQILKMINAQYKTSENSDQKIWDMLHYISNFQLKVDGPYPAPPEDNFHFTPEKLKYNIRNGRKGSHLGRHLMKIVEIAKNTEDAETKAYLVKLIAHYMRIAYATWHQELPNNTLIEAEINQLGGGELVFDANTAPKQTNYAILSAPEKPTRNKNGAHHRPQKNKRK